MKIQDQVCTLEQAKKLKELGVEQKVLWQWKVNNVQSVVISTPMAFWIDTYVPSVGNVFYAAFTVAELGVMLPISFISFKVTAGKEFSCAKLKDNYPEIDFSFTSKFGTNEAEARAEMLIYLLENKLIKAEEVNQRLSS